MFRNVVLVWYSPLFILKSRNSTNWPNRYLRSHKMSSEGLRLWNTGIKSSPFSLVLAVVVLVYVWNGIWLRGHGPRCRIQVTCILTCVSWMAWETDKAGKYTVSLEMNYLLCMHCNAIVGRAGIFKGLKIKSLNYSCCVLIDIKSHTFFMTDRVLSCVL